MVMRQVLTERTIKLAEFENNPTALLEEADDCAIAILKHGKTAGYFVPAAMYEHLMSLLDDYELGQLVATRRTDLANAVDVSLDDL